jgi:hypothetical protein
MQMADNGGMAKAQGKDSRITIRLSSSLRGQLEAAADEEGRSLANLINRVLQLHVDAAKAKGVKRHG